MNKAHRGIFRLHCIPRAWEVPPVYVFDISCSVTTLLYHTRGSEGRASGIHRIVIIAEEEEKGKGGGKL